LSFDRQFSLENYFSGQGELIIENLKSLITKSGESLIGLWGGPDSGKTHLINACAHFARQQAVVFQLYEGNQLLQCDSDYFDIPASCDVLAVDNLDALCGQRPWEKKFCQLINRCKSGDLRLIFTLADNPQFLLCALADFQSRLSWGLLLQLPAAEDSDIERIIRQRAKMLGLDLSNEVMAYLLTRYSRRLSVQIDILRLLDDASLSAQKKITIPLIKQTLIDPAFSQELKRR
jgi:DnaA family protein